KLLDSSGTLDLYIDSMLEKKKKEKEERHGFFRVHRSLLSLVKNYLLWYEDIYLPEDTAGMLVSGDIPFMHRREKYYDKRKGEEEQTDIYGYVILMEGASDEEDTCTNSPGNPLDYERPGDRFFVLIFCPSQKMFLGCRMHEMQEVDDNVKPVIIWSDC
ncbi:MAG: hypothetical protein K9J25_11325, partial [Bacteroidales bacterium]|nr:hypothetical protein [Bacteroidales bacterium]